MRSMFVRTQEQGDAPLVRPDPRRERVGVVEPVGRGGQVGLRAHRAGMDAVSSVIFYARLRLLLCTRAPEKYKTVQL